MRFFLQILLITGLAVGLGGCDAISGLLPGGSSDDASLPEDPDAVASTDPANPSVEGADPAIAPDGTAPDGTTPDGSIPAEEFGDPVVEETNPVGNVPLDLIASTDPEERIRVVQRDRPDPFDILRTTPTLEIPEEALNPPAPPTPPSNVPGGSNTNTPESPATPGIGELAPIPEPPVAPPPPPQPETARAVTVTGVVQIGSVPYAIVDAPNEPHDRYVRSGQFLSNGQVLVKRIEMASGVLDPVVILEEFGIEVARQVGDPGARPDAPAGDAPDAGDVVYVEGEIWLDGASEAS